MHGLQVAVVAAALATLAAGTGGVAAAGADNKASISAAAPTVAPVPASSTTAAPRSTARGTNPERPAPVAAPVTAVAKVEAPARPAPATAPKASPTTVTVTAKSAVVAAGPAATTQSSGAYAGTWGLYAPDFPGTLATVDALQSSVSRTASYVMWYVHWAGPYSALNLSDLASVRANGSTPVVTWMSDDPTGVTTITDSAVASGKYDGYIRSWAQGLRSYRHPVLLRFDLEMNGNWEGWSPGVNGNTTSSFVAAWRHVFGIFSSAGASNVTFVWSPNVDYPGATPMASVYPGDSYVGLVGLDGYNWGTVAGHVWQTPQQVFGSSVAEITAVTSRPLLITEVGCSSAGGDKSGWIGQFFQYLESTPQIHGFLWFDDNKETDWAIGSVPGSLSAFEAGLDG